ncbi:MAG: hypothetical protein OXH76_03780 [Boseongicola sp.]|nr:hypothetical protein [Boseongicola sp.]
MLRVRAMTGHRAGLPRRRRRGLGMWDAMLAVAVLSMLGSLAGEAVGDWLERRLMDEEARAVAELARAGRLYVEADPAANAPAQNVLEAVTFADLDGEDLWPAERPRNTPRRGRNMVLRLWGAGPDRVTVIARARRGCPAAASGRRFRRDGRGRDPEPGGRDRAAGAGRAARHGPAQRA